MKKLILMLALLIGASCCGYAQSQSLTRSGRGSTIIGENNPKPPTPKQYYLLVDDQKSSAEISFLEDGGYKTLSISSNTGVVPKVTDLPEWISLENVSKSEIKIYCNPNTLTKARTGWFDVKAGKLTVRVDISQSAKIVITSMKFGNSQQDGTLISEFGAPIFASDIRYLTPQITYNGAGDDRWKNLYVKVIDQDGSLKTGTSSPNGFTYSMLVNFLQGDNQVLNLSGWGKSTSSSYTPGVYTFELYCDGEMLFAEKAVLKKKDLESTYLKVNGQSSLSANYNYNGNTLTFNISTDCAKWKITKVPLFCEVVDKTDTSFGLKCPYNMGGARDGELIVSSDNQQVRISVSQGAGTGMKINKVWTEHNAYYNNDYGMIIHIEFETSDLKGHTLSPCAFFYYQNGDKLIGCSSGAYITTDGQTTVQETTTSTYDNSIWHDFKLFLPISQLPNRSSLREPLSLKYQIQIIDMTTGKRAYSEYEHFQRNL